VIRQRVQHHHAVQDGRLVNIEVLFQAAKKPRTSVPQWEEGFCVRSLDEDQVIEDAVRARQTLIELATVILPRITRAELSALTQPGFSA
jgi:hypothetical protein